MMFPINAITAVLAAAFIVLLMTTAFGVLTWMESSEMIYPAVSKNEKGKEYEEGYQRQLQSSNLCDPIKTASDLRFAIANVPKGSSHRPTVIRICEERIAVPGFYYNRSQLFNGSTVEMDRFGFDISNRNIVLRCNINSTLDPKERCILDAMDGTGIFYGYDARIVITGFHLTNGGTIYHSAGGAIHMVQSRVVIYDTAFTNNTAQNGGAIYSIGLNQSRRSRLVLNGTKSTRRKNRKFNIEFKQNSAWSGGALDTHSTKLTGTHVLFYGNIATRFGGAICLYCECNSEIMDSIFRKNYVGGDGGAIYTSETGRAVFNRTLFRYNLARLNSPVIDVTGFYQVEVTNSTIVHNLVNVTRDVFDLFDDDDDDDDNTTTIDDGNTTTIDDDNTTTIDDGNTTTIDDDNTTTIDDDNTTTIDDDNTTTIDDDNTTTIDDDNTTTIDDDNFTSFVFGDQNEASAVRTLSPEGVVFIDTIFSQNTRAPKFELANLYIFGNGTAECNETIFCGGDRAVETDSFISNRTSCKNPRFTDVVNQGNPNCDLDFLL